MRKVLPKVLVVCAVVALATTGCSKKSTPATTTPSSPAVSTTASEQPTPVDTAAPVTIPGKTTAKGNSDVSAKGAVASLELEADNDGSEFYFKPTFIKAAPGAKLTIEVKNEGTAKHNFSIKAQHINTDLEAGKAASVTVTAPMTGTLVFFCEYHQALGMQGAVYVS